MANFKKIKTILLIIMSNIKKMPIKVLTTAPCLKMNNLLTKKNYKANNIQC